MSRHRLVFLLGLLSGCALLLTGCLTHEARITAPPEPAGIDEGATAIGHTNTRTPPGPPEQTLLVSPLPLAVPVSAWRRDEDGVISRSELNVVSPLPWWQRFPMDFATDLLPVTYRSEVDATIVETPVTPRTRADLDQEAAAAGYAPVAQQTATPPADSSASTPIKAPAARSAP